MRAIYAIFIIISLVGCNKENNVVEVYGTVTEFGSGKILEGVSVVLTGRNSVYNNRAGQEFSDTVVSDKNGQYRIYEESQCDIYDFTAFKENYYYWEGDVLGGRPVKENILLAPKAWLKLHVKNVPPADENDQVNVIGKVLGYLGANVDKYFIVLMEGNKEGSFYTRTTISSIVKTYPVTLYFPALDTIEYEFLY